MNQKQNKGKRVANGGNHSSSAKAHGKRSGAQHGNPVINAQVAQALRLAMQAHQAGKIDDAAKRYRAILAVAPQQADALHYLGVAQFQLGHHQDALTLIAAALKLVPDYVDARNNLGNVLKECGQLAEAEAAYKAVLAARPDFLSAHNNLGVVLGAQRRFDEAIAAYRQAIALKEDYAEAWHNLGNALKKNGEVEDALSAYRHAILLAPYTTSAYYDLGRTLATHRRFDEALEVYRKWQTLEPDNPVVAHMIAAYQGGQGGQGAQGEPGAIGMQRASDGYLQKTFDSFAESFDDVLASLDYRAPALTGALVAELLGEARPSRAVLDAGCGTGLCAHYLKPYASVLDGVDLSGGMLAKARLRGQYDELIEAELCGWLQQHPARWDLIVSTDTLIYFGALEAVLQGASSALRTGGHLVFTLEAMPPGTDSSPWYLQAHGRFCHARSYIEASLQAAGFDRIMLSEVTLRLENEVPVSGYLVAAHKPAAD